MLLRKRLTVFLAAAMMMMVMSAAPAFAHHCTNVNKQAGAGSIGTVDISVPEGEPTFTKANGAFITITDDSTFSYDVFYHRTLPEGAMASGPGDSECDGRGIDDALACLGIDE